jgi:hypothetical protein
MATRLDLLSKLFICHGKKREEQEASDETACHGRR